MIERTIEISGKQVPFRSSATVPRLYRAKFKRDIFKDLTKLEKSYTKRTEDGDELQIEDLEIFENVAYIMAYTLIRLFRRPLMSGWISSTCFRFTRCCRRFLSCGAIT